MENRTVLQARVDGVNKAHRIANELGPKLLEALKPFVGSKIVKSTDRQLVAKVKAAVNAVTQQYMENMLLYRGSSNYFLAYYIKTDETVNGVAHYYETMIYLGDLDNGVLSNLKDFAPRRTDYTVADVEAVRARYLKAKGALHAAEMELHPFGEHDR